MAFTEVKETSTVTVHRGFRCDECGHVLQYESQTKAHAAGHKVSGLKMKQSRLPEKYGAAWYRVETAEEYAALALAKGARQRSFPGPDWYVTEEFEDYCRGSSYQATCLVAAENLLMEMDDELQEAKERVAALEDLVPKDLCDCLIGPHYAWRPCDRGGGG